MKRPVQELANLLKEKKLSLAFAESMTCGDLSSTVGNVKGTSDFFMGSIICYDKKVKTGLFGIPNKDLKKYSAESQEVTDKLAKKIKVLIKADVCAAVTGLAAPGGSENENKPVGTVFFSVYYKKRSWQLRKLFRGTPRQIRKKACDSMFTFISEIINASMNEG